MIHREPPFLTISRWFFGDLLANPPPIPGHSLRDLPVISRRFLGDSWLISAIAPRRCRSVRDNLLSLSVFMFTIALLFFEGRFSLFRWILLRQWTGIIYRQLIDQQDGMTKGWRDRRSGKNILGWPKPSRPILLEYNRIFMKRIYRDKCTADYVLGRLVSARMMLGFFSLCF